MNRRITDFDTNHAAAMAVLAIAMITTPTAHSAELNPPAGASCVEVIPAQAGAAPAILLDRCSGQTWQLVRSYAGRHGVRYAWHPLLRQDAAQTVQAAPRPTALSAPPAPRAAPRATPGAKCFSFNGRTFCE